MLKFFPKNDRDDDYDVDDDDDDDDGCWLLTLCLIDIASDWSML